MELKQSRVIIFSFLFFIGGTNTNSEGSRTDNTPATGFKVTWVRGVANSSSFPTMGTVGVTDRSFYPFKMSFAAHSMDKAGNLWLYGGGNATIDGFADYDNLWKFDGATWTLHSGTAQVGSSAPPVYGTRGVPGGNPGRRASSVLATTGKRNVWLLGGLTRDANNVGGVVNDLWKYDGTNWTWAKGVTTLDDSGFYGTRGVAAPGNNIPARYGAASWVDTSDNIWIFGGQKNDGHAYADVWKFDGTNWTWMKGANTLNQVGNYGTKGVTSGTSNPFARSYAALWKKSDGTIYMFGGKNGRPAFWYFKDMWKYDGDDWTWIGGPNSHYMGTYGTNRMGTYGVKGVPAPGNIPGARSDATTWVDSDDNLWLLGGYGFDSVNDTMPGELQDLWKFDGTNWTWVAGSKSIGVATRAGVYGALGQSSPKFFPSSRFGAIPWKRRDVVHIFGGTGWTVDGTNQDNLDDQWKFSW